MRKIIISIMLITGLFAQFRPGTISAGALFNYSSSDDGGDYSNTEAQTAIGTKYTNSMTIQPTFSYFLQPNLSVDGYIGFNSLDEENCYWDGYNETCDENGVVAKILGGGATYYMNNLYGGMGVAKISMENDGSESTSKYLEFHGGYLHSLTQNVYLDIGFSQLSGMGEYEWELDDGNSCDDSADGCVDNEYSQFDFKVGIKAFFNL